MEATSLPTNALSLYAPPSARTRAAMLPHENERRHQRDVVVPIVVQDFPFRIAPLVRPRLAHCAIAVYSPSQGVSHMLEWGRYLPGTWQGVVRNYQVPKLRFNDYGALCGNSLLESLHTIAGIQRSLALRGSCYILPEGGASTLLQVARRWTTEPPVYDPLFCSCMHFVANLLVSLGDTSAYPRSPWIRSWQVSKVAPSYRYSPQTGKLDWVQLNK